MKKTAKEKKEEEIVDIGFKIIHLWLKHPEKSLAWVLERINKK